MIPSLDAQTFDPLISFVLYPSLDMDGSVQYNHVGLGAGRKRRADFTHNRFCHV